MAYGDAVAGVDYLRGPSQSNVWQQLIEAFTKGRALRAQREQSQNERTELGLRKDYYSNLTKQHDAEIKRREIEDQARALTTGAELPGETLQPADRGFKTSIDTILGGGAAGGLGTEPTQANYHAPNIAALLGGNPNIPIPTQGKGLQDLITQTILKAKADRQGRALSPEDFGGAADKLGITGPVDPAVVPFLTASMRGETPKTRTVDTVEGGRHVHKIVPDTAGSTFPAYDKPAKPKDTTLQEANRLDRSYQFNSTQLETIRKPLIDKAERFDRLVDTVDQRTPQADALIAPELLTVMAGGQGSGVRINEAEIARVVGGRTNLESLKAAANKWQLDPDKGLSVTEAQRGQIKKLLGVMHEKISTKVDIINKAAQDLVDTDDVSSHRRIVANAKAKLSEIGGAGPPAGWVRRRLLPDGKYEYQMQDGSSVVR